MKRRRPNAFQYWLARIAQRAAWHLSDPYDSWMIEYRNEDGHTCAMVSRGFYSAARIVAREMNGRIVGHSASSIPANEEPMA